MSSETSAQETPRHLWIIGVLALLWNAFGALDYLMTQTRNETYMAQFTPEQVEYFYGFPSWVVAAWALAVWGGVLGCVLLLLRTRWAVPVFAVSLASMVVTTFHNFILSNGIEAVGGVFPLVFSAVIFLVAVALPMYAHRMSKQGVLR